MQAFSKYSKRLENAVHEYARSDHKDQVLSEETRKEILNGQPSAELLSVIDVKMRRERGTFFTPAPLANLATSLFANTVKSDSIIFDPACGAGDLLLPMLDYLARAREYKSSIEIWTRMLQGQDLYSSFVQTARARLLLKATAEFNEPIAKIQPALLRSAFSNVSKKSFFVDTSKLASATHVVMNPPFHYVTAPKTCSWASGRINASSRFVTSVLEAGQMGLRVVAILPDVLRSGERYRRWRNWVENHAVIEDLRIYGRFDSRTNVDVFLIHFRKDASAAPRDGGEPWLDGKNCSKSNSTLSDLFDINVGAVVDYRSPRKGPCLDYIRTSDLRYWEVNKDVGGKRRFSGRTFHGPFLVVARTSGPRDRPRIRAAIVNNQKSVAVDNHLLVLKPKDGYLKTCRLGLDLLKTERSNNFVNSLSRCRHLTVSALSNIPIVTNLGDEL